MSLETDKYTMVFRKIPYLFAFFCLVGCGADLKNWVGRTATPSSPVATSISISALDVRNNILKLTGTGLADVRSVTLKDSGAKFPIASQTATEIQATAFSPLSLVVGTAYTFLLSTATADATVTVTFDELWNSSGSDISYTAGNVGIGTTTPWGKLQINNSTASTNIGGLTGASLFLTNADATANALNTIMFGNSGGFGSAAISTAQTQTGNNGDKLILQTKTIGGGGVWNSNQLVLDTNGRVGIGTATPLSTFNVQGAAVSGPRVRITNADVTSNNSNLDFFGPAGHLLYMGPDVAGNGGLDFNIAAMNAGGYLRFYAGGFTERMRIAATGNVGIGTGAPGASSILDVSSTTKGVVLPRMTKLQRDAIGTPVAGMMVYQTDNTPGLRVYNGTNWMRFTETID